MSSEVGLHPSIPVATQALVNRATRAPTWLDIARAVNCVLGRGCQPVPIGSPINTALTAGSTYTLGFRVTPRYQAMARVWQIVCRASTGSGGTSVSVATPSGGTAVAHPVQRYLREVRPIYHYQALTSQSEAEQTLSIDIAPVGTDALIESIGCVDIPRYDLATGGSSSDLGLDLSRAAPWQPLWAAGNASDEGWHRLALALSSQGKIGRRASLFGWGVPYQVGGATTTTYAVTVANGGGAKNLFLHNPPVVSRRGRVHTTDGPGGLTVVNTVEQRALVWVSVGTVTGKVTFTYTSGATSNASTTSTTPTFLSPADNSIEQEDPTETSWLKGNDFTSEEVAITIEVTAGTGSVYCAGATIFESI